MRPVRRVAGIVVTAAVLAGVSAGLASASTDPPAPRSARFGGAATGDGIVEVAGQARESRSTNSVGFGDGAGETTESAQAQHTFVASATVRASVTTEYRARYRVDGGRAREIPGTVSVEGPETELTVRQARSELIAGPR